LLHPNEGGPRNMGPPRLRRMVRDQPGCFSSHLVDRRQAVLADHDAVPDVCNHPVGRTAEPGAMHFGAKPEVPLPHPTCLTGSLSQFPACSCAESGTAVSRSHTGSHWGCTTARHGMSKYLIFFNEWRLLKRRSS